MKRQLQVTLTTYSQKNKNKKTPRYLISWSLLLKPLLEQVTWELCPAVPRKSHYGSGKPFHALLMYVWYRESWHPIGFWGGRPFWPFRAIMTIGTVHTTVYSVTTTTKVFLPLLWFANWLLSGEKHVLWVIAWWRGLAYALSCASLCCISSFLLSLSCRPNWLKSYFW